jgi:hypothetical protein
MMVRKWLRTISAYNRDNIDAEKDISSPATAARCGKQRIPKQESLAVRGRREQAERQGHQVCQQLRPRCQQVASTDPEALRTVLERSSVPSSQLCNAIATSRARPPLAAYERQPALLLNSVKVLLMLWHD